MTFLIDFSIAIIIFLLSFFVISRVKDEENMNTYNGLSEGTITNNLSGNITKPKTKGKVLADRFVRGFTRGFISSALTVGVFTGANYNDLWQWVLVLGLAGVSGGITGALLAIDKFLRWKERVEN
jgi:hypothetical protein